MTSTLRRIGLLCALAIRADAQSSPLAYTVNTPRPLDPALNSTNPSTIATQSQNPFLGSVPQGPVEPGVLQLSLDDAIQRALKANLGLIASQQEDEQAKAARLRALSKLLPQISAQSGQHWETLSLNTIGGHKLGLPPTVGPFAFETAGLSFSQNVLNLSARHEIRASREELHASEALTEDARNIVALPAASAYALVAASASRMAEAKARLDSAITFDALMANRVRQELSPELDSIRARVIRQTAEQSLELATIRLEKDKLALTRIIGLHVEQQFTLNDALPYVAAPVQSLAERVQEAAKHRADLKAAEARVKVAEEHVRAQLAERMPAVGVHAAYGGAGTDPAHFYQTYAVAATVEVPLFTGRRIEANVADARAVLRRRQAEAADLRARVGFDIRTALLDLQGAQKSVDVAQENIALAKRGHTHASDRFEAGVSNALELVQAEEAVAQAKDNYIASVTAYNLAKLALIRAMGTAEQSLPEYLGSQK